MMCTTVLPSVLSMKSKNFEIETAMTSGDFVKRTYRNPEYIKFVKEAFSVFDKQGYLD